MVTGGVAAVSVAVAVVLLARDAATATAHLRRAERAVQQLQQAIVQGDSRAMARSLRSVIAEAAVARSATSGAGWRAASAVPYLGRTARTAHVLTDAVDELSRHVLPELVATREALENGTGRTGGVNLAALSSAGAHARAADDAAALVRRRLAGTSAAGVLGPVTEARDQMSARIDRLAAQLHLVAAALPVAAQMLGADGPRRYFLALQNDAEARGTGGLVGAFAIVEADHGRVRVVRLATDDELPAPASTAALPVDLGADFAALYAGQPALWANSNESPHFPYAAQLWLALWARGTGERLDGAIAIDPTAAGYLLEATGPLRMPDGELVTADNVVAKTERDVYARFAGDQRARKQYLVQFGRTLLQHVLDSSADPGALLAALQHAVSDNRLLVYSARADEQAMLARTAVAGVLPDKPGPLVQVVVNNGSSGKLDYYLHRSVTYTVGGCAGGSRDSEVAVELHSEVPSLRLPPYVLARHDPAAPMAVADSRLLTFVYLPVGAAPTSVTLDGRPVPVFVGRERGRPVVYTGIDLAPNHPRLLQVRLTEPAVAGAPQVRVQPLVQPQRTVAVRAACP